MPIYKITNKINGKIYIGKCKGSIKKRWRSHYYERNTNKTYLSNAILFYGIENFKVEKIESCPANKLDEREAFYIKTFKSHKSYGNGYNMTSGGEGGDTSKSPNYIAGMKNRRDYSGKNNPNYRNRGKDSPLFGIKKSKSYCKKMSLYLKKAWDNNPQRKKKLSRKNKKLKLLIGNIPQNAVKIKFEGKKYNSIAEACRKTKISKFNILKNCERL